MKIIKLRFGEGGGCVCVFILNTNYPNMFSNKKNLNSDVFYFLKLVKKRSVKCNKLSFIICKKIYIIFMYSID
jgi:hypothetical protein